MNNQILLGLSVVTIACIYMIYQNFKRDREVNEIKSRVNNMNSIITETVNKMRGEMLNINQKVQVLNQSIQLPETQSINVDNNLTNKQSNSNINQVYNQDNLPNNQSSNNLNFPIEDQSINFVENNLSEVKDYDVEDIINPIFEQQVGSSREDLNNEYIKFKENKLNEFESVGNLGVDIELNNNQLESSNDNELNDNKLNDNELNDNELNDNELNDNKLNDNESNNEMEYSPRIIESDENLIIESLENDNVSEITYDDEDDEDDEDMENNDLGLSIEDINRINELGNIENDTIEDLDLSSIEDSVDENVLNNDNLLDNENNDQKNNQNDFVIQELEELGELGELGQLGELDDLQELGELGELGEEELGNSNTEALDDLEENAKMTTRDELEVMTVKNLKVLARNCGVKSRGNKNDLVDRIYQKISASTN